jgi:hypothetical protein
MPSTCNNARPTSPAVAWPPRRLAPTLAPTSRLPTALFDPSNRAPESHVDERPSRLTITPSQPSGIRRQAEDNQRPRRNPASPAAAHAHCRGSRHCTGPTAASPRRKLGEAGPNWLARPVSAHGRSTPATTVGGKFRHREVGRFAAQHEKHISDRSAPQVAKSLLREGG